MNRFVIIIEEDYDCYTVDMPHKIITEKSLEEIKQELSEIGKTIVSDNGKVDERYGKINFMGFEIYHSNFIGDSTTNTLPVEGYYKHERRIPIVYTVDEWFSVCE